MNIYSDWNDQIAQIVRNTQRTDIRAIDGSFRAIVDLQRQFQAARQPHQLDVGFYYTNRGNVFDRRGKPKKDIPKRMVLPDLQGRFAGTGIYTSSNALSHTHLGDTGLLVVRLAGHATLWQAPGFRQVTVVRQTAQVVPVIAFPTALIHPRQDGAPGNQMVHTLHQQLQRMLDDANGRVTPVWQVLPSLRHSFVYPASTWTTNHSTHTTATPNDAIPNTTLTYRAPRQLSRNTDCLQPNSHPDDSECSICLSPLNDQSSPCMTITTCGHSFHQTCIAGALGHSSRCPVCRTLLAEPQGTCPSGTMTISTDHSLYCTGDTHGTIVIEYHIPSGTQLDYHQNPGARFTGAQRTAYVPNIPQGRQLVKRLQYSFLHGLTFVIGTSMTSGATNIVTWSSIHHKTSTSPGPHGYPDDCYLANCHGELTALGVPADC